MNDTSISISLLLSICGAITAIWGVYKIFKEIRKPSSDLQNQVQRHEELLHKDNERLNKSQQDYNMICRCLLVQLDHQITGNGIEKLKQMRSELNDYLIHR